MTFTEKVKGIFTKIGKRNLIIIGAVALIGVAVCLNLVLFSEDKDGYTYSGGDGMQGELSDQKNPTSGENSTTQSAGEAYFSSVQVNRQRARDEALEVLNGVLDNQNATEEVKAEAIAEITQISLEMKQEANIESIIVSKGFERCVTVINGDTANVVVSCSGTLSSAQLAQINAVVFEQAGIEPVNITIVGKAI